MLIRIVRMTFKPEKVDQFLEVFNTSKSKIRNFPGCNHLELHRDYHNEHIFSTYSHWDSDEELENYRHSDLFKDVWARTKVLFDDKPVAFSHKVEMKVDQK